MTVGYLRLPKEVAHEDTDLGCGADPHVLPRALSLSPSPIQPRYPPSAGVAEAASRLAEQQGSPAHGACKPSENGNERPSPRSQEFGFTQLRTPSLFAAGEQITMPWAIGPDGESPPPYTNL